METFIHTLKKQSFALVFLLGILWLGSFHVALAQCDPTKQICNPIQSTDFLALVTAISDAIVAIGIPLVAIFLVWSGFLFVTAGGNEEQLRRAKTTFFWALVGGAVVIGAKALAIAIVNFAKGL